VNTYFSEIIALMIWNFKTVRPTIHGNFEWRGCARKGFKVFKVRIYPETHQGDHFFTLRSVGPDFGLDVDGHFATVEQAKAYAEGLADAWRDDKTA